MILDWLNASTFTEISSMSGPATFIKYQISTIKNQNNRSSFTENTSHFFFTANKSRRDQ
jgi:hypothetical protein